MRICSKCKQTKPINAKWFYRDASKKSGFGYQCKKCCKKRKKEPRYKKINLKYELKRKFQITLEQYDQMFEKQHGVCKICNKINTNGERLAVDHNHITGKIRGLLCSRCNNGLGCFRDDIDLILKAGIYLEI